MNVTRRLTVGAIACGALMFASSAAGEKWDMPLAYAATNYHSQNAALFAAAVTEATGGELEIVPHASGSLFKGAEIFRAVRTGQAPIGERLISALGNEDPIFEVDALPFLATSFDQAWNLYQASKPAMQAVLEKKGVKLLYAVPCPPRGSTIRRRLAAPPTWKASSFVPITRRPRDWLSSSARCRPRSRPRNFPKPSPPGLPKA